MLPKQHVSWASVLSLRKLALSLIAGKKSKMIINHNSFLGHGKAKLTDEQREITRLKKDLRDAKMEAEILKKAIGNVFAAQIIRTIRESILSRN